MPPSGEHILPAALTGLDSTTFRLFWSRGAKQLHLLSDSESIWWTWQTLSPLWYGGPDKCHNKKKVSSKAGSALAIFEETICRHITKCFALSWDLKKANSYLWFLSLDKTFTFHQCHVDCWFNQGWPFMTHQSAKSERRQMFEEEKTFQEKPVSEIIMKIGDNWEILLLLWEQIKRVTKALQLFWECKNGDDQSREWAPPQPLQFFWCGKLRESRNGPIPLFVWGPLP